jgi:hypothetical protein
MKRFLRRILSAVRLWAGWGEGSNDTMEVISPGPGWLLPRSGRPLPQTAGRPAGRTPARDQSPRGGHFV